MCLVGDTNPPFGTTSRPHRISNQNRMERSNYLKRRNPSRLDAVAGIAAFGFGLELYNVDPEQKTLFLSGFELQWQHDPNPADDSLAWGWCPYQRRPSSICRRRCRCHHRYNHDVAIIDSKGEQVPWNSLCAAASGSETLPSTGAHHHLRTKFTERYRMGKQMLGLYQ